MSVRDMFRIITELLSLLKLFESKRDTERERMRLYAYICCTYLGRFCSLNIVEGTDNTQYDYGRRKAENAA
jgi:hypothetical protein